MSPEHKIARHHLGDRLHWIGRGGPHADEWIVQAWPDRGHMLSAQAPTVDEAAADCAARLRAAGWVPTHPRLEWVRAGSGVVYLEFRADNARLRVATCRFAYNHYYTFEVETRAPERPQKDRYLTRESRWAAVVEWCAATLPNYHLPPFPETPDAS